MKIDETKTVNEYLDMVEKFMPVIRTFCGNKSIASVKNDIENLKDIAKTFGFLK